MFRPFFLRLLAKAVDLVFRPDEIAAIDIRPATGGYTGRQADQFYGRVVERVHTLPGVRAAATSFGINFAGRFGMKLDPLLPTDRPYEANMFGVNPGYFDTFGARILAGRDFNAADASNKEQVYIISEHLAKTYFHGENPVGRYLKRNGGQLPVVGVVSDIRRPRPPTNEPGHGVFGRWAITGVELDGVCALRRPLRAAAAHVENSRSECRSEHSHPGDTYLGDGNSGCVLFSGSARVSIDIVCGARHAARRRRNLWSPFLHVDAAYTRSGNPDRAGRIGEKYCRAISIGSRCDDRAW